MPFSEFGISFLFFEHVHLRFRRIACAWLYIYDLVPRVLRLLHLLVSPFLTSQQETLSCPRPLCPKISRTEHSILH